MKETSLPFGMLFQEAAQQVSINNDTPYYDPVEGLSYMVSDGGKSIPYIKWAKLNLGTITGRMTRDQSDPTDKD